jgi:hypothetical protein
MVLRNLSWHPRPDNQYSHHRQRMAYDAMNALLSVGTDFPYRVSARDSLHVFADPGHT